MKRLARDDWSGMLCLGYISRDGFWKIFQEGVGAVKESDRDRKAFLLERGYGVDLLYSSIPIHPLFPMPKCLSL